MTQLVFNIQWKINCVFINYILNSKFLHCTTNKTKKNNITTDLGKIVTR